MKTNFFYRLTCLLGFMAVLAALGTAYYMQHYLYLEPCPMCMLQRIVFILLGALFLWLWLLVPGTVSRRVWAIVLLVISTVGILLAYRHLQIINTPPDLLATGCSSQGIATEAEFWSAFFSDPLTVIREAIAGGSTCAKAQLFYGLLIPSWAMLGYIGLAVLAMIGAATRAPRHWLAADGYV